MATARQLFCNQDLILYIDEEVPCLVNEWRGFVPSFRFREYIQKLLDVYKESREQYEQLQLLADTRKLHVLSHDDTQWVAEEINPKYLELGITHEAFIVPRDKCGETVVQDYISESNASGVFTTKMFSDFDEARNWLKDVQAGLSAR